MAITILHATIGRVYYWRVSLDPSLYPTTFKWKESSFIYIPQKNKVESGTLFSV